VRKSGSRAGMRAARSLGGAAAVAAWCVRGSFRSGRCRRQGEAVHTAVHTLLNAHVSSSMATLPMLAISVSSCCREQGKWQVERQLQTR
jgi:lipopolysaccharide biosynthesis regulator YciM